MRRIVRVALACLLILVMDVSVQAQITRTMLPVDMLNIPVNASNVPYPITARSGAGSTCTAATLNTAITAIGSTRRTLILVPNDGAGAACTWTLEANVTTNANTHLVIAAPVSVNVGMTLTLNGSHESLIGPDWYSGAGTVTFSEIPWGSAEAFSTAFPNHVRSGGIHGTSGSTTSPSFATRAWVNGRDINESATTITYACGTNDVAWTIISSDTDGITGWTRVGTTGYYYLCEGDTTPTLPTLPANSAFIMGPITITASAITAVKDRRTPRSLAFRGVYDITDPLYGGSIALANNSAAVQAIIDRIDGDVTVTSYTNAEGGIIYTPPGRFDFTDLLNFDNKRGIQVLGAGGSRVLNLVSHWRYTPNGTTTFIRAGSSAGLVIRGMHLETSGATYTGDFIDLRRSSAGVDNVSTLIEDNWIGATSPGATARSLIRMNQVIIVEIRRNQFINGQVHLRMGDPAFVVRATVDGNTFNAASDVAILGAAGESISIMNNTFEPGALGESRAYRHDTATWTLGLVISGNWFGDASAGANYWLDVRALGAQISGNRAVVPTGGFFLRFRDSQGIVVSGNQAGGQVFIEFFNTTTGIFVFSNDITGITTAYSGVTNVSVDSYLQSGPDVNSTIPIRTSALSFRGLHNPGLTNDRLVMGRFAATPSNRPYHGLGILDDQSDGLHLFGRSDNNAGEVAFHTAPASTTILTKRMRVPGDGGLHFYTGTRPSCDVAHRGTVFYVAGGAGVLDTFEVCRKDAADVYAWVSLF